MKCPRCNNENVRYFYQVNGNYYCRKCISFGQVYITKIYTDKAKWKENPNAIYHLEYCLTKEQLILSKQLVQRYQNHLNSKVKAVCGAGKTEIVYPVIQYALQRGDRVCFTTPRKELTKELYQRINQQFSGVDIGLVYGGYSELENAPFVICTTHQLYRYPKSFDLLILDEMDAFPYHNNEVLQQLLLHSIKGSYIFMSATMQEEDMLVLQKRYHGYPIPLPTCKIVSKTMMLYLLIRKIKYYSRRSEPVLVYVPTIVLTTKIAKLLNRFHVQCRIAHSKVLDIKESIELLASKQIDALICTTVLERGITISNVQVIILFGEHPIYDTETLIQIVGRVGRKIDHPTGKVTIYSEYKTKAIRECIKIIHRDNA